MKIEFKNKAKIHIICVKMPNSLGDVDRKNKDKSNYKSTHSQCTVNLILLDFYFDKYILK